MRDKSLFIGIDTSNYTTSIAVTDESGNILSDKRKMLEVKEGERGLRQSGALFQHVNNLPRVLQAVYDDLKLYDTSFIKAVSCSTRPRPVEGSYMPVFNAGISLARSLAMTLKVPLYGFSHQEGHVEAACLGSYFENMERFGMFHLSGGTTEILLSEGLGVNRKLSIIGGTKDISFGQLLDRVGVALGFPFPAGKYLDEIAERSTDKPAYLPKIKVENGQINLSGLETHVLGTIGKGADEAVVKGLFYEIICALEEMTRQAAEKYGIHAFIYAGGVASSNYLRKNLSIDIDHGFGRAGLCADNAVGVSLLGGKKYGAETHNGITT